MKHDFLKTLMELRRDSGLTPGRIRDTGRPLMEALGVSDADEVRRIIADSIKSMGPVRHALVLKAAYGLDAVDALTSLATRQSSVAKKTRISIDTVKRDERRAINELHELLFPRGETMRAGSYADHRIGQYLNALEYIDLDAHSGEAQFSLAASNHFHNDGDHIPNTPSDAEWRDDSFLAATSEVRKHVTALLACVTGWPVESLTLTRPDVRPVAGRRGITQRIDSAQDLAQPGWNSISALLHLRRWQMFRDVDDGLVDLYITPSAAHPWDTYTSEVYNDAFASRLVGMREEILKPVTAIVQQVLQQTLRLAYSGSVKWERGRYPCNRR